jgi:GTP diphosphokinase / guanosine-3',5'-bis(diphosphate) 3'-diphosphatase
MTIDLDAGAALRAVAFAAHKHRDQRRKDPAATPYVNHPIALAELMWHAGGVRDSVALIAAILHDTIEDTATTADELIAVFGPDVAAVVGEVTDDKTLPKDRRKQLQIEHAPHLSTAAKLVKLADKICNLRDIIDSPPSAWSRQRCAAYVEWTRAVVDGLRGVCPALEAIFDGEQARWAARSSAG